MKLRQLIGYKSGRPAENVMVDQRKDIICAYTSGADISLSVYSISKSC
jgi:hypothetical protein